MHKLYILKIVLLNGLILFSVSSFAIITDDFVFPESDLFTKKYADQVRSDFQKLGVKEESLKQMVLLSNNGTQRTDASISMGVDRVAFLDNRNDCFIFDEEIAQNKKM